MDQALISSLQNLINSNGGLHLTAYFQCNGDSEHVKLQLEKIADRLCNHIISVKTPNEVNQFLEPIESVLADQKLLRRLSGQLGVFRSEADFRILKLPFEVAEISVVATSFHVKPLFRWQQLLQDQALGAGSNLAESALAEFEAAEAAGCATRDIFEVAQAVNSGQVKKLIVASDVIVFGKMNVATGAIEIHQKEADHEDDDLLDDLAQEVSRRGGHVVVSDSQYLPQHAWTLAILNSAS